MTSRTPARQAPVFLRVLVALVALCIAALSVVMLERAREGVRVISTRLADAPATIYLPLRNADGPLVIVAHGFAGSRQMMSALSLTLARSGMTAVAFDFPGQGRHRVPMSRDVTTIDGTTQQLVAQTEAMIDAARTRTDHAGPTALVGHSMATDVIVRAAEDRDDVAAVVAVSMYSDAVTATHPARLLIVSGAWEERLRRVAVDAARLVDGDAAEGTTVRAGDVVRRVAVAPGVEHVGVLYSPETLREVRAWIADATGSEVRGTVPTTGPWIGALLGALLVLAWPVLSVLGPPQPMTRRISAGTFAMLMLVPIPFAAAAAALVGGDVIGLAGFGRLVAFFGLWGFVQLVVLARAGWRPAPLEPGGMGLLLGCALVFALALDRYGAAFLPAGQRFGLMIALLPGTIPYMLADATLARAPSWWQRIVARATPVVVLTATMAALPDRLGLMFTVLPVLLLFYLVYGTMGRWAAVRAGPMGVGAGLGIVLAWAIAASTPLFTAL